MIAAVPGDMPTTTPVDASMVATDVLALFHVPPLIALESVVVAPWHTCDEPVMPAGNEFTVTTVLVKQPVLSM